MKKIVLASSSAQRKRMLESLGLSFVVDASNVDEDLKRHLSPRELVKQIALKKVLTVAARHANSIIIGADTVLVTNGKVSGKHRSAADVKKTLRLISGKTQHALTGVAIIDTSTGKRSVFHASTMMRIRKLSEREIVAYARSNEWVGKAGGYSVLGIGGTFVEHIRGNYENIVGLPVPDVIRALKKFGVAI